MPLEHTDVLDLVSQTPEGDLQLVITDSGLTRDPDRRYRLLVEKATQYLAFALSPDFRQRFPGVPLTRVVILVLCHDEPTPAMRTFTRVQRRSDPTQGLALRYEVFRPES